MKASQAPSNTADKPAQNRFIIAEFAQYGGRGYHCDTSDLSSIVAILNCPEWTELEINAAVAAINEQEGE